MGFIGGIVNSIKNNPLEALKFVPGPIGMTACGISMVNHVIHGDAKGAIFDAVGMVPFAGSFVREGAMLGKLGGNMIARSGAARMAAEGLGKVASNGLVSTLRLNNTVVGGLARVASVHHDQPAAPTATAPGSGVNVNAEWAALQGQLAPGGGMPPGGSVPA